MSESCRSEGDFSSLLISDLILLCSFTVSHPLYFCYFIFFSPYLLKLISFLSPLFITTFLLSLAFLTGFVHENFSNESSQTKSTRLLSKYTSVLERLRFKNDEFQCLDDLGMYDMLFGSSMMEERESTVEFSEEKTEQDSAKVSDKEDLNIVKSEDFAVNKLVINPIPVAKLENSCSVVAEKRLENFLKILGQFERMASSVEEKKKLEPSKGAKVDKVVEKPKASEATGHKINDDDDVDKVGANNSNGGEEYNSMAKAHSQRITTYNVDRADEDDKKSALKAQSARALDVCNLSSYGSMRKEKEWKRTLACKLFEERHNVDGGEGMDSLWEAYEMDSNKPLTKQKNARSEKETRNSKNKNKKKSYEEYEEEEDQVDGQLCCLQALKFSTSKMNLGMGRPNLVKITKAIKGFGWLHHVSKHSKKVHDNGDRY